MSGVDQPTQNPHWHSKNFFLQDPLHQEEIVSDQTWLCPEYSLLYSWLYPEYNSEYNRLSACVSASLKQIAIHTVIGYDEVLQETLC